MDEQQAEEEAYLNQLNRVRTDWDHFLRITERKESELLEISRRQEEVEKELELTQEKLRESDKISSAYQHKNKEKKKLISKLKHEMKEDQRVSEKTLNEAQQTFQEMAEKWQTEKEELVRRIHDKENLIIKREATITKLEQQLYQAQHRVETLKDDVVIEKNARTEEHLEEISKLQDKVRQLESEVRVSAEARIRCEQILTTTDSKFLGSTPYRETDYNLLTYVPAPQTGTICSTPRKRPDRVIARQREHDYWIPKGIFTYTNELLETHFPKSKADIFYNYLVECSKEWRHHYNLQVERTTATLRKTINSLRKQLKVRRSKIDQLEAANTLRELKAICDPKNKSAPFIPHKAHVKDLRHACNAIDACLDQIACLEQESYRHGADREELSKSIIDQTLRNTQELMHNIISRLQAGEDTMAELEGYVVAQFSEFSKEVSFL
eukprot:TRINITY_DN34618_c0_g1_i1.p1 TRINITY_DN34618_c0_g1~~TRINITY_DN34618_c0_g1_i1.p1  ORF type:complete len:455 (+),score=94.86 TRINITY_DN34618_c0_g1_i1:50-1366(+)